jgi:hypothetical protein
MNWSEEQQAFWQWITRPQDLRHAATEINSLLTPHSQISQTEALGIYNNAYHQRMIQISAELYPVTYHTLGHEVYARLWLAYMAQHPPRPGPMAQLGEHLLTFVQTHPQFGKLPALLSLVELESLLINLFDVVDETAYSRQQLQSLSPAMWASTRWTPKADWAVMHSQFDLEDYWARMQAYLASAHPEPGATAFGVTPASSPEGNYYLIRRVDHRMQFQQISPTMKTFLTAVCDGKPFAEICEHLALICSDQDIAALSLGLLLTAIDLQLLKA